MPQETALVTGASSGIGQELARLFAADKSNLVLVARRKEKLEELAAELRGRHGVEVRVIGQDLADPAAPDAIFQQLTNDGVAVDVLVNNAGFGSVGKLADLPLRRQLDMIQVNVAALAHLTRLFLPGMLQRGAGGVLNVASTAAFQPGPLAAVYFATKAFVLSLTEALAEELSGEPVNVTCLAPGATRTGFGDDSGMGRTLLFKLGTMDAKSVALAGYQGFRRGRVLVVPGLRNKLTVASTRIAPRRLVRKIVKRLQQPI